MERTTPSDKIDALAEAEQKRRNSRTGAARGGAASGPNLGMVTLPPPTMPMDVARVFVARNCTTNSLLTLRHWRGGWWLWRRAHWIEAEDRAVKSLLYRFTEKAIYWTTDKNGNPKIAPWAPTRNKIGDLTEALAAICILPKDRDQPSWLDDRRTGVIVSVANGLLDIETRRLLLHTPQFFNQTSVPFDYNPKANAPTKWLEFLAELWPAESAAILVLGEWFGYVISGRTDLQKIFLNVGPTRGGKGVIARVLTALVGRQNMAGPTLNSLGGEFGLAPLIGKVLGVISDARFGGRDSNIVIERLLSISGEDTLTVNRKYRDQWTGKLPIRLHIISNELPKLGDASTAIVGRIVLLLATRSWLGKEDHDLEPTLCKEFPGILNWALEGLARLTNADGRFTRLPSADEAIVAMRDLASPVAAFVRERCRLDGEIAVDALYIAYCSWAADNGHAKPTKQNFGRFLGAAFPLIRVIRPRDGETRPRRYCGIALAAEKHVCLQCGKADGRQERCFIGGEEVWLHPECQREYAEVH
jgi:putative DNA primase/helicase